MKNKSLVFISLLVIIICSLTNCSGNTKKALGLHHTAPDESNVFRRPDLSIPPNFDLPAPKPDQVATQKETPVQADKSLTDSDKKFINKFNKTKDAPENLSKADQNLMKKLGK
jgi:hypothetical protein